MQQYQKFLTLAAVAAAAALSGCASKEPAPTSVVVIPTQTVPSAQATASIRNGTVVAVQNMNNMRGADNQGMRSSGGMSSSGASAIGQLVTVQFEDGQQQLFQVAPGGQQFQVGDRVVVNTNQGTALITR